MGNGKVVFGHREISTNCPMFPNPLTLVKILLAHKFWITILFQLVGPVSLVGQRIAWNGASRTLRWSLWFILTEIRKSKMEVQDHLGCKKGT
jgi:hypothetical protein